MNTVTFVTDWGANLNVFFVVLNRVAYLISWRPETMEFGYLCPCCMLPEHREAIASVVASGLYNSQFDGKVHWCCHQSTTNMGDRLDGYSHLNQAHFCAGNAEVDLDGMKGQIQAEAGRQGLA